MIKKFQKRKRSHPLQFSSIKINPYISFFPFVKNHIWIQRREEKFRFENVDRIEESSVTPPHYFHPMKQLAGPDGN